MPSAARYQSRLGETGGGRGVLGYTRPFRQSGLVLSPFPSDFIGLNGCSIYPSSSVPNLAKRSLLFVGSGWVKGDPLIPFLFRLRFSSALRDGIGVFKPISLTGISFPLLSFSKPQPQWLYAFMGIPQLFHGHNHG